MTFLQKIKKKFYISPLVPLVLVSFILLDPSPYTLIGECAALIHEMAHFLAIKCCHAKMEKISLMAYGADISINSSEFSYKQSIFVSLAGVFVNAIAICMSIPYFPNEKWVFFALSNLCLFVLNILPIKGLDGGEALYSLICLKSTLERADKIIKITTRILILPLICLGLYVIILSGWNLSMLLVGLYLLGGMLGL